MLDASAFAHRPHRGRHTVALELTDDQRAEIETILRRGSCRQAVARRAQALLLFADAVPSDDVARLLGVDPRTVFKWKKRFDVPNHAAAASAGDVADIARQGFPPPSR